MGRSLLRTRAVSCVCVCLSHRPVVTHSLRTSRTESLTFATHLFLPVRLSTGLVRTHKYTRVAADRLATTLHCARAALATCANHTPSQLGRTYVQQAVQKSNNYFAMLSTHVSVRFCSFGALYACKSNGTDLLTSRSPRRLRV